MESEDLFFSHLATIDLLKNKVLNHHSDNYHRNEMRVSKESSLG